MNTKHYIKNAWYIILFISLSSHAQQLSLEGGNMVVTGTILLSENMSLNIDGNLNSKTSSTIHFVGNTQQNIKGSGTASFSNIVINNSSTGVQLQRDISASGDITMNNGDFDLLDYTLDLGLNGALVGENTNSMCKSTSGNGSYTAGTDAGDGEIVRTINISTSGVSNAAGEGISITPTSNWGNCQLIRQHQRVVGFDGDNSIFRTYTISPTNAANLIANISIKYASDELNGNTSGSLKIYQLKDNGAKGVEWEELSSTDNGSEVTATTNDNNLSEIKLTLAGTSSILPISLLSFSSYCDGKMTRVQWKTASEINNDYFILDKSIDGIHFEELIQIAGAGTSNSLLQYEFLDISTHSTTVYYRLTQIDYNGNSTTFDAIVSKCGTTQNLEFIVVNPAKEHLNIMANQSLNKEVVIRLFDSNGRELLSKTLSQNQKAWHFPIYSLAKGMYQLMFISENNIQAKSIIITN